MKKTAIIQLFFSISVLFYSAAYAGVYEMAVDRLAKGEYAEVIGLMEKKKIKDMGDYNLLGWAYLNTGKVEEAMKAFEQSLTLEPSFANSQCGLAYCYYRKDLFEKALFNFESCLKKHSSSLDCLLGKGLSLEKLDRKEDAYKAYKEVLAIDGNNRLAGEKVRELGRDYIKDLRKESR